MQIIAARSSVITAKQWSLKIYGAAGIFRLQQLHNVILQDARGRIAMDWAVAPQRQKNLRVWGI